MDSRLLLVKSVTLLYRESLLINKTENSKDLVNTIIQSIKLPELSVVGTKEKDILYSLKQTVLEMCQNPFDIEYEKTELLQRLKLNCFDDEKLYECFEDGINTEIQEPGLKRSILSIRKAFNNHFREEKLKETINNAYKVFNFSRDKINDLTTWTSELIAQIEPFKLAHNLKDPAITSEVDLSDEKAVASVFKDVASNASGEGILRTSLQGLNEMLQGGFRRGEEWVIGALQHNFKSGFSLKLFCDFCLYNTPYMLDPNKKPLMVRISFEDGVDLNLRWMYKHLYELETKKKCIIGQTSEDEMAKYIRQKLFINGYHVKLLKVSPSNWSYSHIFNKLLQFEAEGFEVHCLMIDYLAMMPTTGCINNGPIGSDIRDLFRRVREFTNPRKITFITPHQLSTEAKQLVREERQDFVKIIANRGYYDKCKTLDQEVDGELYIHIEKINRKSYLTIQRGKHRGVDEIPDEKKYIVYPFHDVGTILPDLNGPRTDCKKVGGGPIGSGDEIPFWESNSPI